MKSLTHVTNKALMVLHFKSWIHLPRLSQVVALHHLSNIYREKVYISASSHEMLKRIHADWSTARCRLSMTLRSASLIIHMRRASPPAIPRNVSPCINFNNITAILSGGLPDNNSIWPRAQIVIMTSASERGWGRGERRAKKKKRKSEDLDNAV